MNEIWKPVPFALNYQASSLGNILSPRGKLLHPSLNHRDYLVCDLNKRQYRVNRIICTTFHGDPPTREHHAAHKDSDQLNNREDNLYWATPLQNAQDLLATGRNNGENAYKAVLKEAEILEIRQLHADGIWCRDISKKYPQVSYENIQAIIHRRSWKHLP